MEEYGGTIERITYGAIDSPARPFMAAIDSQARSSNALQFDIDGPARPIVGGLMILETRDGR